MKKLNIIKMNMEDFEKLPVYGEHLNGNMWSFPLEELDYLLNEQDFIQGEDTKYFALMKDYDGEMMLFELDEEIPNDTSVVISNLENIETPNGRQLTLIPFNGLVNLFNDGKTSEYKLISKYLVKEVR